MSIFYYILDGTSPKKRAPFSGINAIEQFSDLNEALKRYRELPDANEKVLGLSDGLRALELVRCVPLFPTDREGASILSSDPRKHPFWAGRPEAILAMETCKQVLKLRYMTQGIIRVPIPDAEELPDELKGKRLWMKEPHDDPMSAIKSVTAPCPRRCCGRKPIRLTWSLSIGSIWSTQKAHTTTAPCSPGCLTCWPSRQWRRWKMKGRNDP